MNTIKKIVVIAVMAISFNGTLAADDVVKYDRPQIDKPVVKYDKPQIDKPVFTVNRPNV